MTVDSLNLEGYTPEELDALVCKIKTVKKESKLSSKQRYQSALNELVINIQEEAVEVGVAMSDVYKAIKQLVAPSKMYQHPSEAKTWSGRGKKPGWLMELLANGADLDSLKVA